MITPAPEEPHDLTGSTPSWPRSSTKSAGFAFRRRHYVALLWIALLTLAGVGAASAPAAGASSFSVPGTEAQKAFDLLEQRFPGMSADGATARVVFKAPAA